MIDLKSEIANTGNRLDDGSGADILSCGNPEALWSN
jgi:hypothetical protein